MIQELITGISLPFLGTVLGSACVFFMKKDFPEIVKKSLTGFAAGIMTAASIWSLLDPAVEQSESMGRLAFLPAASGFMLGIFFLLILDTLIPHLHLDSDEDEGVKNHLKKSTKMMLAVTLHNIPEGMAVGVVYAGWVSGESSISLMGALALAIGIAIQNFPEGAIISMPLRANGVSRKKSFIYGAVSGAVEPVGAVITILFSKFALKVLPGFLGFAAGAMIYVVVEELIPEMSHGRHSNAGTVTFSFGFVLMMILDIALG